MNKSRIGLFSTIGISVFTLMSIFVWIAFFLQGKRFALRDRLCKADAIIALAGTRGKRDYLDGKISTAVHLYKEGWASHIIFTGKFSVKVTEHPHLISVQELQVAATKGRIQEKDIHAAATTWDVSLGAEYMRDRAVQMGVPCEAILIEPESLHTRENADFVLELLKKHHMKRVILVTSPFHQLRTYLTFAKVFQPYNIHIINYHADTDEWNAATWFLSSEHRKLMKSEKERIKRYREKGDIL